MFTRRNNQSVLIVICLAFITTLSLTILKYYRTSSMDNTRFVIPIALTTPTPTANPSSQNSVTSLASSDGKATLVMKKQQISTVTRYTFLTSGSLETSEKPLLTNIVDSSHTFSLPFNSWSPDNRYIFLKENEASRSSYLVLTSSGNPIRQNTQFVNIAQLFLQKYPDYHLEDVTGWAAPALLVINARNSTGEPVSFWFDLESFTFIRLSTRFN